MIVYVILAIWVVGATCAWLFVLAATWEPAGPTAENAVRAFREAEAEGDSKRRAEAWRDLIIARQRER